MTGEDAESMKSKTMLTIATATVALAVLGGAAISAQDKYSLKVPGGLAFSSSGDTRTGRLSRLTIRKT